VSAEELAVLAEPKVPILIQPPIDPQDYGRAQLVRTMPELEPRIDAIQILGEQEQINA
jgi:hypothetical protein